MFPHLPKGSPTVPSTSQFVNPGTPLPASLRHGIESLSGMDLSDVRVHQGHNTAAMGAQAYTQGNNIFFRPGQYNPHTPECQQLLGHELTHVVQQRGGVIP
jgi:hypothetical protein